MRFRRLEVRSYRAINRADVDFGPGLNVLYGPNDLGKTTMASAMRAALLLPADSTAHQAFVAWHGADPPRVSLSFERGDTIFRVSKSFGHGSLATARLETSLDGVSFHEEERGRAVDRRLREVLRWGIDAPGGKGAARGLPESFLSHVLLAAQSGVPEILERTLVGDRDASGREQLHDALQALAQDPIFKRVLEAAQARVESAFTPTGRRKTGQSSPFAPLKEQIANLAEEFERLAHQRRESEEVEQRIARLSEERLAAEAEVAALEERAARQRAALEQLEAQQSVRDRHAAREHAVREKEAAAADLHRLEVELTEAQRTADGAAEQVSVALSVCADVDARMAEADEAVSELTSEQSLARQAQARAELDSKRLARQRELSTLRALLDLEHAVAGAEAAWQAECDVLREAEQAQTVLLERLASVDEELNQARRLEGACLWREASVAAERARAARVGAAELEARARELRQRAAQSSPGPGGDALAKSSHSVLTELRHLEGQIRVAAARLEVGLSVVVKATAGTEFSLSLDGGPEALRHGVGEPLLARARSRVALRLPGAIELEATAGDPELHRELEQLERRWAVEAVPLLSAAEVEGLDALAERVEAERASARDAVTWLRDAEALELRAAGKRELGAELELWERRAEERRQAVASIDPEMLREALEQLGTAWEGTLKKRISGASAERARLQLGLEAHGAAVARVTARLGALAEAHDAAILRQEGALSAAGPALTSAPPTLAELQQRVAMAEHAEASARSELDAWEHSVHQEGVAARRARELVGIERARAHGEHDKALAASLLAKERQLTLTAQFRERKRHVDAMDLASARAELERARVEVDGLEVVPLVTPDQLASTQARLDRAIGHLNEVLGELRRAEGALGHVGGDVVVARERQTAEALTHARALELDQEREYEAYRLLAETLRAVENEQGSHLGRALEAPVSERFQRLTEGRYKNVCLDAGLGLHGVVVAGQPRAYRELSEGTQEQLATILRLCIAEHLESALVLDDHLAQTHRQRAEWFRGALRDAAHRIQIVVLTARPEDYLSEGEMCDREPFRDVGGAPVRAIDLERVIERAH